VGAAIWLLETILLLGLFNFVATPLVQALTRNRWIQIPISALLALPSAALMAWMRYVPYLLFFVWATLNYHSLKLMERGKFEADAGMRINKPLFWISSYLYIVLTCALAWFLQMEIGSGDHWTPLWKHLLRGSR